MSVDVLEQSPAPVREPNGNKLQDAIVTILTVCFLLLMNVGGLGFPVFLIFLVLKLCHVIDWSYLWVTSPLWIPAAFSFGGGLISMALCVAYLLLKSLVDMAKRPLTRVDKHGELQRLLENSNVPVVPSAPTLERNWFSQNIIDRCFGSSGTNSEIDTMRLFFLSMLGLLSALYFLDKQLFWTTHYPAAVVWVLLVARYETRMYDRELLKLIELQKEGSYLRCSIPQTLRRWVRSIIMLLPSAGLLGFAHRTYYPHEAWLYTLCFAGSFEYLLWLCGRECDFEQIRDLRGGFFICIVIAGGCWQLACTVFPVSVP